MKLTRRQNILTLVVAAVVLVVTLLDVLSPVLLQRELTGVAREASRSAARTYLQTGSTGEAAAAARLVTDRGLAVLTHFEVLPGGSILVSVGDDAGSYYLSRIPPLHPYFTVERSATAPAPAGPPPSGTPTTTTP